MSILSILKIEFVNYLKSLDIKIEIYETNFNSENVSKNIFWYFSDINTSSHFAFLNGRNNGLIKWTHTTEDINKIKKLKLIQDIILFYFIFIYFNHKCKDYYSLLKHHHTENNFLCLLCKDSINRCLICECNQIDSSVYQTIFNITTRVHSKFPIICDNDIGPLSRFLFFKESLENKGYTLYTKEWLHYNHLSNSNQQYSCNLYDKNKENKDYIYGYLYTKPRSRTIYFTYETDCLSIEINNKEYTDSSELTKVKDINFIKLSILHLLSTFHLSWPKKDNSQGPLTSKISFKDQQMLFDSEATLQTIESFIKDIGFDTSERKGETLLFQTYKDF